MRVKWKTELGRQHALYLVRSRGECSHSPARIQWVYCQILSCKCSSPGKNPQSHHTVSGTPARKKERGLLCLIFSYLTGGRGDVMSEAGMNVNRLSTCRTHNLFYVMPQQLLLLSQSCGERSLKFLFLSRPQRFREQHHSKRSKENHSAILTTAIPF